MLFFVNLEASFIPFAFTFIRAHVEQRRVGMIAVVLCAAVAIIIYENPVEYPVLWTGMNASGDGARKGMQPPS